MQPSLAIAHLLQVTIDHVRYAVARKPEHRLERMARSEHDWRGARHLQRLAGAGGGRQEVDCGLTRPSVPGEKSKHPRSVHVTLFVRVTLHFWTQPDQLFWCKFDNGLEFRNDASCAKYMTNRLAGPPLLNQPPGPPLRKPLRPPPVEPTLAPTRPSRPAPCPFSAPFAIIQSITYSRKRVVRGSLCTTPPRVPGAPHGPWTV